LPEQLEVSRRKGREQREREKEGEEESKERGRGRGREREGEEESKERGCTIINRLHTSHECGSGAVLSRGDGDLRSDQKE